MVLELTGFRNYQQNVSKRNRTLERLSTGYRINRSADDAAGLAVSEKLQLQVSGTEQAGSNVKDAISLVQTGEAAMQEIHDMLGRLYTLAEQSSNGTYENEVDRENLQKEVSQLKSEIDRISESTNYNGIPLLSGGTGVEGIDWSGQVAQIHQTVSNLTGQTAKDASPASWTGYLELDKAVDGSYVEVNGVRFEFWSHESQFKSNGNDTNFPVYVPFSDPVKDKVGKLVAVIKDKISYINANENNASNGLYGLDDQTVSIDLNVTADPSGKKLGNELTINQREDDYIDKGKPESGLNMRSISIDTGNVIKGFDATGRLIKNKKTNVLENININHITNGAELYLFGQKYTIGLARDGDIWQSGDSIVISWNNGSSFIKRKDLTGRIEEICDDKVGLVIVDDENIVINYNNYPIDQRKDEDIRIIVKSPDKLPSTPDPNRVTATTGAVTAQNASRTELIDFSKLRQGDSITVNGKRYEFPVDGAADEDAIKDAFLTEFQAGAPDGLTATAEGAPPPIYKVSFLANAPKDGQQIVVAYATKQEEDEAASLLEIPCNTFIFQIGASAEERLELRIQNVSVRYLGLSGVDVSAQEEAADSMDRIKKAVDQLSDNRGVLGAAQNRLEHTENQLGVVDENLTNALSTIRDASMAKEVIAHTKNQILSESAQSMMAQSENLLRQRVQFFTNL